MAVSSNEKSLIYSGLGFLEMKPYHGKFSWTRPSLKKEDNKILLRYDREFSQRINENGLPRAHIECTMDSGIKFSGEKRDTFWVRFDFWMDDRTVTDLSAYGDLMALVSLEEVKRGPGGDAFGRSGPTNMHRLTPRPGMGNNLTSYHEFVADSSVLARLAKTNPFMTFKLLKLKTEEAIEEDIKLRDTYPDFAIESESGKVFNCHKFQLAKLSPVFEAIFKEADTSKVVSKQKQTKKHKNKTKTEVKTERLQIEGFSDKTIEDFINYAYARTLKDSSAFTCQMLQMANKYQVPALSELCDIQLAQAVTRDTLAEMWATSVACSASRLKEAVLAALVDHWADRKNVPGVEDLIKTDPEFLIAFISATNKNRLDRRVEASYSITRFRNCDCDERYMTNNWLDENKWY